MPRSPREYLKPYAQHHQHMPLPSMYQDHHIPSQDMCLNQVPTCASMHQPVPQPVPSTMYHNKCINHAPNLYHQPCTIPCAITMYHTMFQPCTSTMYINTCTIPCTKPINQEMYQQCISTSRPQPTCTMHPMMCLKSYTKSHKHMPQACSSISPRCNLITQYTKPQICTITCNQTRYQDSQ
jgi:hypothetical protein